MSIYRGVVTAADSRGLFVRVSALSAVSSFGPLAGAAGVGESVLVGNAGTESEPDLVLMGGASGVGPAWKSGSIAPWNYGEYADLPEILAEIERLGLNTVNIPVPVAAVDIYDSEPAVDADRLAWALEIAAALPAHIRIIAEPYPWIADGTLSETLWNPSNKPLWFTSWTAACVEVAEAFPQAAMVYVGSNLALLEADYADDWIALAGAIRAVTGAQISYRCNWWYESTRLDALCSWSFLQVVDVVSVAAYFELTDTWVPGYDEVRAALECSIIYDRGQDIVADVTRLHETTGKPIFFGELVCSKWVGALAEPWNPDVGTTRDPMVQQRMYRAYVDAFGRLPWWLGFSVYGIAGFDDSGYVLDATAADYLKGL